MASVDRIATQQCPLPSKRRHPARFRPQHWIQDAVSGSKTLKGDLDNHKRSFWPQWGSFHSQIMCIQGTQSKGTGSRRISYSSCSKHLKLGQTTGTLTQPYLPSTSQFRVPVLGPCYSAPNPDSCSHASSGAAGVHNHTTLNALNLV